MTDHCPTCKRKMPTAGEVRTIEQNKKMWAMLREISQQKEWHGRYLTDRQWKHIFSASICEFDAVPNLENNGFVVIGQETSQMKIPLMSRMIELMTAFGVEHGIRFADDPEQEQA